MTRPLALAGRYVRLKLKPRQRVAHVVVEFPICEAGLVLDMLGPPPNPTVDQGGLTLMLPLSTELGYGKSVALAALALLEKMAGEGKIEKAAEIAERFTALGHQLDPHAPTKGEHLLPTAGAGDWP